MEGLGVIGLIWGILCIILFFKVWRACNDIKRIAEKYAPDEDDNREKKKKRSRPHSTVESAKDIEQWLKEGE